MGIQLSARVMAAFYMDNVSGIDGNSVEDINKKSVIDAMLTLYTRVICVA